MQHNEAATNVEFHYNATRDCFATSPSGHNYSTFLDKNKNVITSRKAYYAAQNPVVAAPSLGLPSLLSHPPPPTLSSDPSAAIPQPAASATPHRTFDGINSHPTAVRRYRGGDVPNPKFIYLEYPPLWCPRPCTQGYYSNNG